MYSRVVPFLKFLPFYAFYFCITWLCGNHIFFWDTVQLGSKHAHFFFENNFDKILLPDEIDSGHIPVFGAYLALCWKLFGKTLFVSHFAMLPLLFGIVFQASKLIRNNINGSYWLMALIILLAEPSLLAQSTLISPDVALAFFFIWSLNYIVEDKKSVFKYLALLGLSLISMRGMMAVMALLLYECYSFTRHSERVGIRTIIGKLSSYIPGFIFAGIYFSFHYFEKGWFGYHEASPWAPSFERADLADILKNLILLAWRMLDFGRVFLWIIFIILIKKYYLKLQFDLKIKRIAALSVILLCCLAFSFVTYKGLNGHRYLIPVYLSFNFFICYLLFNSNLMKRLKMMFGIAIIVGQITGHLWIYPKVVSQGWDASLAHIPYFDLHEKMIKYMKTNDIGRDEVGSLFPNLAPAKFIDLSSSMEAHQTRDIGKNKYFLDSNIYNEKWTEREREILNSQYRLLVEYRKMAIYMRLYQKK